MCEQHLCRRARKQPTIHRRRQEFLSHTEYAAMGIKLSFSRSHCGPYYTHSGTAAYIAFFWQRIFCLDLVPLSGVLELLVKKKGQTFN